ncbi:MAG: hypothetical protein V5B32_02620 [Candidatus Accumulibacter sp. UW26]|jgi:Ni2+-binding GTPase involved in maturation of urease and hydrogenase
MCTTCACGVGETRVDGKALSSPGSGKTSLLCRTVETFREQGAITVIAAAAFDLGEAHKVIPSARVALLRQGIVELQARLAVAAGG